MEYNLDKLAQTKDDAMKILLAAQYQHSIEKIVNDIESRMTTRHVTSLEKSLDRFMESLMDEGFTEEQIANYLIHKAKQTR